MKLFEIVGSFFFFGLKIVGSSMWVINVASFECKVAGPQDWLAGSFTL